MQIYLWAAHPMDAAAAAPPPPQVADLCHSVVLTSGTLAPLEGFASEVGWGG